MVEVIDNTDLVMVHENETGIFGYSAENCADIISTINSDKLRLVYDPGNFVWGGKITDNIKSCWPIMKPYVVHVHIKDWKKDETVGSIPGKGDGQIPELLQESIHLIVCANAHPYIVPQSILIEPANKYLFFFKVQVKLLSSDF